MNAGITDRCETIDYKTSRSICDAVGERLRQNLAPESSGLSPHLQRLMDELRQRDGEEFRGTSSNQGAASPPSPVRG